MTWTTVGAAVLAWHIASRLAYVIVVGVMLTRQDRHQAFTRTLGVEAGFRRFRRIASLIMNIDGASFILLCLVTRQTLPAGVSPILMIVAGVALCVIGVGTKAWAASSLGGDGYYWRNFFDNEPHVELVKPGPYRFLKNPMYTVGNLHMYGFALVTGSLPGLAASAFDQAAVMIFNHVVEKPHFARVKDRD